MFEQFRLEVASLVESLVNLINSICGGKGLSSLRVFVFGCFWILVFA